MPWPIIAQLIIQVGYPMAMQIWQNAQSGLNATQAQWDALEAMSKQTAQDRMKIALTKAGVPLDSAQAVALLSMAQ